MGADALNHLLAEYGYGVVFGVIGLEAMGVPFPGESMLIAAGIYAATAGKLNVELVIAAAASGAILGDNAGYLIGRWAGFPLIRRYGRYVGLNDKRAKIGQYLFQKHGGKVVFVGRFIAILRTFVALMAGANHMEWKTFLLWNAVGGVLWTTLYVSGAYLLGDVMSRLQGKVGLALAAIAIIVVIAAIIVLRRNEKRLEDKAEQAMDANPS
jgi:membrane protein DedA with SNARE-associated domain